MRNSDKTPNIAAIGNRETVSVLKDSILFRYIDNTSDEAIIDRNIAFDMAVNAFKNEAIEAFIIPSFRENEFDGRGAEKYELTRYFILKLLLYIGYDPDEMTFSLIARLIEMRVRRPNISFSEMLTELSQQTGIAYQNLDRDLERSLGYYNDDALDKVTYITGTVPLSARDIICDLAVYVRTKYFDDVYKWYE